VKAEITVILYKDQIKHLKSQGVWPVGFDESSAPLSKPLHDEGEGEEGVEESAAAPRLADLTLGNSEEETEDNDDASEIFQNTNRFGKMIYF
jgi:hypothetical protein